MNWFLQINSRELWHIGGWTMVHYLWLGTLAGILAAAMRLLLSRAGPDIRYAAALVSLVLLAILPIGITGWLVQSSPINTPVAVEVALRPFEGVETSTNEDENEVTTQLAADAVTANHVPIDDLNAGTQFGTKLDQLNARQSWRPTSEVGSGPIEPFLAWFDSHVGWLPWLWLAGTPITLALLATGMVGSERLRRSSCPITVGPVAELAAHLARSLRVSRRVTVAVCECVAAPVLVGILKPVILLPPAALTGWSPDEIEMVLLHELAHVRRCDNLVNLMQRLIESLLFFHPAVWFVSRWVRSEREACCDAFVVRRTSRPHAYAELLVALAAQMPRSMLFQPAASSALTAKPLRKRIRRILQLEDDPMLISGKSFALVLAAFITAVTLVVLYLPNRGQAEEGATEGIEATEERSRESDDADDSDEPSDAMVNDASTDQAVSEAPRGNINAGDASNDVTDNGNGSQEEANEMVFETYQIPGDLVDEVATWVKLMDVRHTFRDNRLIMQASRDVHVRLRALLEAAPKWNDPHAVAERERNPIVMSEEQGEPRVEWRTMGLTLGPPRQVERPGFNPRHATGLHIVNVEPGSPAAWSTIRPNDLLTKISAFEANDLSQSVSMIKALLNGSTRTRNVIWVVRSNGNEFFAYVPQAKSQTARQQSQPQESPRSEPASAKQGMFLSLEEQKLADLAYRRLGLELEPIGEEELQRVKALRYEGGVKVANGRSGVTGQTGFLQAGDILVGLHVWATTSMEAVAEILRRDDLAELNPLKFYVVRRMAIADPNDATKAVVSDAVQSGRIMVSLGANHGASKPGYMFDRASTSQQEAVNEDESAAAMEETKVPPLPDYELPSAASEAAGPRLPAVPGAGPAAPAASANAVRQTQSPALQSAANDFEPRYAAVPTVPHERQRRSRRSAANREEIEAMREHVEVLETQFERLDALYKTGSRGGSAGNRALAGYELARAKAELALAERRRDEAVALFEEAKDYAEESHKAFSAEYEAGNTTYDVLLQSAKNLAEIKRQIAQLKNEGSGSASVIAGNSAATGQPSPRQVEDTGAPATSSAHESVGVLRKIVEREKQKYDRLSELAKSNAVSASEVAEQKAEYEISLERLKQAERALEYYRVTVELAKADYEAALEANKAASGAVSQLELRKRKLKVEAAEAQLKAMSE